MGKKLKRCGRRLARSARRLVQCCPTLCCQGAFGFYSPTTAGGFPINQPVVPTADSPLESGFVYDWCLGYPAVGNTPNIRLTVESLSFSLTASYRQPGLVGQIVTQSARSVVASASASASIPIGSQSPPPSPASPIVLASAFPSGVTATTRRRDSDNGGFLDDRSGSTATFNAGRVIGLTSAPGQAQFNRTGALGYGGIFPTDGRTSFGVSALGFVIRPGQLNSNYATDGGGFVSRTIPTSFAQLPSGTRSFSGNGSNYTYTSQYTLNRSYYGVQVSSTLARFGLSESFTANENAQYSDGLYRSDYSHTLGIVVTIELLSPCPQPNPTGQGPGDVGTGTMVMANIIRQIRGR